MTDSTQALRALRTAHGEFVTTLLATHHQQGAALIYQQLACNTQVAHHLRMSRIPMSTDWVVAPQFDINRLLAELAESCALIGDALRGLPTLEMQAVALVESVIGGYRQQTAALLGG